MMQQSDVSVTPGVPITSFRQVLSQEVRASLEAVRVAQEEARLQARRQTRQARLWFATMVGVLALGGFAVGPRLSHWWHARRHKAVVVAHSAPVQAQPVPPEAAAAPAQATTAAASSPVENTAPPAGTDEGCDTTAVRTAPWRLSPEACARAFVLHPDDAALALAVAHAEHAHGHLAEGAQWARRALALDPEAAEAYVLIARADVANGRPQDARTAYRHYLQLAPRGWHHAEARAAVRSERKTARL
jgi:hypothetical protein